MRVVPSDVVRLVIKLFNHVLDARRQRFELGAAHAAEVRAIIALFERVPEGLLILSSEDFTTLLSAVATLRGALEVWQAQGDRIIVSTPGFPGTNPLTLLVQMLQKCPDSAVPPATAGLEFIGDADLREALRLDKADADRALANGEWKGATVLGGSLLEALLLWALQQKSSAEQRSEAITRVKKSANLQRTDRGLDEWQLHELVEVAAELKLIREDTAKQARLAKNFRNLIHPGREQRLAVKCGRGEALGTLAAGEQVISDLARGQDETPKGGPR